MVCIVEYSSYGSLIWHWVDASVDEFIKSVQEYAQDDYAVIYTSSSAKQSVSHIGHDFTEY